MVCRTSIFFLVTPGIKIKLSGFSKIIFKVSLPKTSTIALAFFSPIPLNRPDVRNSIIESFYEKSNMSIDIFKIYAEFIASGIISIYTDWLNSNSKMTLEELTVVAKDAVLCGWQKIIA